MNLPFLVYVAARKGNGALLNAIYSRALAETATAQLFEWEDERGRTALDVAADNRDWNLVHCLAVLGADVNRQNRHPDAFGETVLHRLLRSGDADECSVTILLEAGAKVLLAGKDHKTAWELAKSPPYRDPELSSLFQLRLKREAVFEERLHFTETKVDGTRLPERCVYVLVVHLCTQTAATRPIIAVYSGPDHRSGVNWWIDSVDLDPPEWTAQLPLSLSFSCHPMLRCETQLSRIAFRFGPDGGAGAGQMETFLSALRRDLPPGALSPQSSDPPPQAPTSSQTLAETVDLLNGQVCDSGGERVGGSSSGGRPKLCQICMDRPINTGFVHGNSVHCCACEKCARLVMRDEKVHCPVCREEVQTLVTNFYM